MVWLENFHGSFKVPLLPIKREWQIRALAWFSKGPLLRLVRLADHIAVFCLRIYSYRSTRPRTYIAHNRNSKP